MTAPSDPTCASGCQHCRTGYLDRGDLECVNGVLVDIDVAHEGWQRDVAYPPAPCMACKKCGGTGGRGRGQCRSCNGSGWRSGQNESQERLSDWAASRQCDDAADPTGGLEPIRQIAIATMRRCGTCRWWERDKAFPTTGACGWGRANMPASLRAAPDMHADAGTDCATWKDRADGE